MDHASVNRMLCHVRDEPRRCSQARGKLTASSQLFDIDRRELATDGTEIDIAGQGTGPDGRPFTVRADRRGAIDSMEVHTNESQTFSPLAGSSFEADGREVTTTTAVPHPGRTR